MSSSSYPSHDYRAQSPAVADRFAKLKRRPVVLEVDRLSRHFAGEHGPVTALRDVSFQVHRRDVTGNKSQRGA